MNNSKLKVAYYGFVKQGAGSGSGGQFLILEELVRRGLEIDFYGYKGFTEPTELLSYSNFQYKEIPRLSIARFIERLPNRLQKACFEVFNPLFINVLSYRLTRKEILRNHQFRQYDLLVFVELCSPFRIEGIPVISWLQGPPHTEWLFIRKLKEKVISLCGLATYLKLAVFYRIKLAQARKEIQCSDFFVCCSPWSREQLIQYGISAERIKALPYPMDMSQFKFNQTNLKRQTGQERILLYLGRIVPRKRLDLLLEAFELVLQERQDVKLKIVGRFDYSEGYRRLIDHFPYPDKLEYCSVVDRELVPALMTSCDFLVQPSEGENFGSSVAEAVCMGLPVIIGPSNGTRNYIGSSAFVFNEYTPDCLKSTILEALKMSDNDRDMLTFQGRRMAERNFNSSNVVDQLEGIFGEVVSSSRAS